MDLHFDYLLNSLRHLELLNAVEMEQFGRCCELVQDLTADEINALLDAMLEHCSLHNPVPPMLLTALLAQLITRQRHRGEPLTAANRTRILALYEAVPALAHLRWGLLQWLATAAAPEDLEAMVDCVVSGPGEDAQAAALAFTPLFQNRNYDPAPMFPRLFAALQHLAAAAPVLDLANYLHRSGMAPQHPAAERADQMVTLLGSLVEHLQRVDENPQALGVTPQELGQKVDECVALVVALCGTLAVVAQDHENQDLVIARLQQALDLRHRRIRTEAAAALAQLGDQRGIDVMVELVAEPVARLRVLAYAEELGLLEQIAPEYRTEVARAESQIALELAQPSYFGVPPSSLELLDSRTLFWPGYEDPVDCFLLKFEYRFDAQPYQNVAIAGPLVHAFVADLGGLPVDDIYAVYAGWHVEEEGIFEIPLAAPTESERAEADRFERQLRDHEYDAIHALMLGNFFGDWSLVARATRDGAAGLVVVDPLEIAWFPQYSTRYPLGAREVYSIYKGRRLLRSFNS